MLHEQHFTIQEARSWLPELRRRHHAGVAPAEQAIARPRDEVVGPVAERTRHGDDAYVQELLRAGVAGYVLKQSAPNELIQAIRAAAAGGQYIDSTLTARMTARFLGHVMMSDVSPLLANRTLSRHRQMTEFEPSPT